MGLLRCLPDPLLDLAFRHPVGPATMEWSLVHGKINFVAPITPADTGITESLAKLALKYGYDPAQPSVVTKLTLGQLIEKLTDCHALHTG